MNIPEEYLQILQGLRLMDDDFFNVCFADSPECIELILRIILNRDDLRVIESKTQYSLKNLHGRSVRFDVYAEDSEGKGYDIEIQRSDDGADPRRARYNSSLMDMNRLKAGEPYKALRDNYVIFITEHDVLRAGLPLYTIHRTIEELNKPFGDGSHIIYVNGSYQDDSPLGRLMSDFQCLRPNDFYYPQLQQQVRFFKEDPEGVTHMCKAFEQLEERSLNKGIALGRLQEQEKAKEREKAKAKAQALLMLNAGLSISQIVQFSDLTQEEVEEIAASRPSN